MPRAITRRSIRRLAALLALLTLSSAGPARSAADEAHPFQAEPEERLSVATTGALSPAPLAAAVKPADPEQVKAAIAAYRRGALKDGDAIAATIDEPAARAVLEWAALRSASSLVPFRRIEAFLAANPNYPATAVFRRRAEEMLIAEKRPPAVIRAFFHGAAPVSPAGRVALALALRDEGRSELAAETVRTVWRQEHLGAPLERLVLAEFPKLLTVEDHKLRTERYLFRENGPAAMRNAERVSTDYVKLARARLAVAKARAPVAASVIGAAPAAFKDEPPFLFMQAQQARRADKFDEAADLLAKAPRDATRLGDGDGWWTERRLVARRLLDGGDAKRAYVVAAGHAAEGAAERIDAEWHAGFIALRFEQNAARALDHFTAAAGIAETPISVARASYWQGRAAEALGRREDAEQHYEVAAEHPIAYYGQLARARLGHSDLPLRRATSVDIEHLPGHRGVRLLYEAGARDLAAIMLVDLSRNLHTTPALEAIASIARREGDVRTLLAIGKLAVQRGFPLDMAAYPTDGVPDFALDGAPPERAMVHAIARQESAFDPTAVSHAGARGLMQMMPATARETARRSGLPFDLSRLGSDALYSAQMGAAHLGDLLREWRGSYILTFAAYNAGSGNVRRWIAAYGDPRSPDVDAVDWVERIPFYETRNYVQRVMENLQVYRQRLDQRTASVIDQDLKRGAARE